jgi:hypothetical protein
MSPTSTTNLRGRDDEDKQQGSSETGYGIIRVLCLAQQKSVKGRLAYQYCVNEPSAATPLGLDNTFPVEVQSLVMTNFVLDAPVS